MAEIASAAVALASLVLKLSKIAYDEVNRSRGVVDGVERLSKELSMMQCFLKDAEKKLDDSNSSRQWVSDVRDLAYEAEDVIDTFLLKLGPDSGSSCQCFSFIKSGPIASQLEKLSAKADDISKRRERYGLICSGVRDTSNSKERLKKLRELGSYADNDFIVGLVNETSTLKEKLKNGGSKRYVISILGMGGLGKTTLARKLYTELEDEYPCHAWVCVSQEYETKDILLRLIKSTLNPERNMLEDLTSEDSMARFLRKGLKNKTFLIVLDDLWSKEAWGEIERFFPKEETGSRIIVTTRIGDVAKVTSGFILSQKLLYENDSWELFCRKAFPNDDDLSGMSVLQKYGEEIIALGKQMVAKCSGLPLAIVTLGALLSIRSLEVEEWKAVNDNLFKEIRKEGNGTEIDAILSLSFNDLSDHLKLCLLYVAMFPEDHIIRVTELMRMWEAEGFIEHGEEENAERITKSYFNELVGRSLLIIVSTADWPEEGLYCRVHDLVRELAIKNAKEIRYSAFYSDNKWYDLMKVPFLRRLVMHKHTNDIPDTPIDYTNKSLRTLRFEMNYRSSYAHFFRSLNLRFPLLRVLLIDTRDTLPLLQMGELINLRYLWLRCRGTIKLPENLGNLKYLQTLDVMSSEGSFTELPKTVVKLQSLKHLCGKFKNGGCWIGELAALETLYIYSIENWLELDTTKLGNLRHLNIGRHSEWEFNGAETSTSFLKKLKGLKRLQRLCLKTGFPFKVSEIFEACPGINYIKLMRSVTNPVFGEFASNLQVCELTFFNEEHFHPWMTTLEKLPKLRALRFEILTKRDLEYTCSQGGFCQLRTLKITFLECYNTFHDDSDDDEDEDDINDGGLITLVGGMPLLTNLIVKPQNKLRRLERGEQSTMEEL